MSNLKFKGYIRFGQWQLPIWRTIIVVLFILGSIATVIWFFNNFERVSKTSYQLTDRAILNPYFASELLLNQRHSHQTSHQTDSVGLDDNNAVTKRFDVANNDTEGHADVTSFDEGDAYVTTLLDSNIKTLLDDLPDLIIDNNESNQYPVLILNSMSAKLSKQRFNALQHWVEQGGHLITFAGRGINDEDLDKIEAYVQTLKQSGADAITIQNDAQLQKLISEVGANNQFLAQLGIITVSKSRDCYSSSDSDCRTDTNHEFDNSDISEAIEKLEAEYGITLDPANGTLTNQDDVTPAKSEASDFKLKLENLQSGNELTVVAVPNYETNHFEPPLMIKKRSMYDEISTEIFDVMYPQASMSKLATTNSHYQTPHYRSALIRQYLKHELARINQSAQNSVPTKVNLSKLPPNAYDHLKFNRFIELILTLNDQTLSALFLPATTEYVDVPLGKGRLSVLVDNDSFSNPNPNRDIYNISDKKSYTWSDDVNLEDWSPLIELIDSNYRNNLSYVNNADMLLTLTKNASQVLILPNTDIEPLSTLLWRQSKLAVLGLVLLLLIWLWSLNNRFGRNQYLSQLKSHDILRYFSQVGRYGWDKDKAETLLRSSRQQIKQKLYENLPRLIGTQPFSIILDSHRLQATHAKNPNANPLANLTDKDLTLLSNSLIKEFDKKFYLMNAAHLDSQKAIQDSPTLASMNSPLPSNQQSVSTDNSVVSQVDAKRLLSANQLSQTLIQPIQTTYSAQTFSDMTQTLWLLNWVLR